LARGTTIGSYQVVDLIGRGGMAEVYRAFHPKLSMYRAIKVVLPLIAEEEGFAERFQQEAVAMARLRHPHILEVIDFGEQEGMAYLVTEYIDGGSLAERAGIQVPVEETAQLLAPIAAALDYAHTQSVLHRDVKPSNILLDRKTVRPVLSDFGIAKLTDSGQHMTRTGAVIGTPAYQAPEQASGLPAIAATDQYALAVVAYELLTGRVPFKADTPLATLLAHLVQPLPAPRLHNPSLPEAVDAVLERGLAKRPEDRYPTVAAFTSALEATGAPLKSASPPTFLVTLPPTRRADPPTQLSASLHTNVSPAVPADGEATQQTNAIDMASTKLTQTNRPSTGLTPTSNAGAAAKNEPSPVIESQPPADVPLVEATTPPTVFQSIPSAAHNETTAPPSVFQAPVDVSQAKPTVLEAQPPINVTPQTASAKETVLEVQPPINVVATAAPPVEQASAHETVAITSPNLQVPDKERKTAVRPMPPWLIPAGVAAGALVIVALLVVLVGPFRGGKTTDATPVPSPVVAVPQATTAQLQPTVIPTAVPTVAAPTSAPTESAPTAAPTPAPPTPRPTFAPTAVSTAQPTKSPPIVPYPPPSPMSLARAGHAAVLLEGGKVVVFGGTDSSGDAANTAELYDPASGHWISLRNMAIARLRPVAVSLTNGTVLVVGNGTAGIIDPSTNAWSATGPLPSDEPMLSLTMLGNGKVLGIGATKWSLYSVDTKQWAAAGSSAQPRKELTATLLKNGKVLVVDTESAQLYDPATNAFSPAGSTPSPGTGHTATMLTSGQVLVVDGKDEKTGKPAAPVRYDPVSNSWSSAGRMLGEHVAAAASPLRDGGVLVMGGPASSPVQAERYDPASNTWSPAASPKVRRSTGQTATLLLNGQVMLAGGQDGDTYLNDVELFDPTTNKWTAGG
jgi:serine/threonine-protein kinase